MLASINTVLLLLSAPTSGGGRWEAFKHFYNDWFNIPGFEIWKFVNLAIFLALMIYIAKKPLSAAFKAKREQIRAELIKAEAEKKAALARLETADAKLAGLEAEKANILSRAKQEAEHERERLVEQTAADVARMKQQADAELARLSSQTRAELRRFSAEQSIRLAEVKLRSQIDATSDARLVRASIQEIGGLN